MRRVLKGFAAGMLALPAVVGLGMLLWVALFGPFEIDKDTGTRLICGGGFCFFTAFLAGMIGMYPGWDDA